MKPLPKSSRNSEQVRKSRKRVETYDWPIFVNNTFNTCERTLTIGFVIEKSLEIFSIGNRAALKGLAIGTTLGALSQATLNYCIVNYATLTLEEAGISMNPLTASIILAVALIFGSLVSSCIADTLGRKKSMLISLLMSAFGLLATALYNYLKISGHELSAFSWIPVAGVSIVVFSSSAGIGPLSLTCSAESVPTKVFISAILYHLNLNTE